MKQFFIPILTFLLSTICLYGQHFDFTGNNPFGLQYVRQDNSCPPKKLLFTDIDNDGDMDALLVGVDTIVNDSSNTYDVVKYFVDIQMNTGTKYAPVFNSREPFMQNFPYPDGYFTPSVGDLNQDGLVDFIVCCGVDSSLNLKSQYYKRKLPNGVDQFDIIDSDSLRLNNFVRGSVFLPELTDLDMDGDLDLLMSGFHTRDIFVSGPGYSYYNTVRFYSYQYAKNIGTSTSPIFYGWHVNPYGLSTDSLPTYAITGDIDNDRDMDVLTITQMDTFEVFSFLENIPQPNGKPFFQSGSNSPFGLPKANRLEAFFGHSLVDIDADGDLDLFVPQRLLSTGTAIGYYENKLCAPSISEMNASICPGDSVVVQGQTIKAAGEYYFSFEKPDRCDSIIHFSLTVLPQSSTHLEQTICNGEVVVIGSETFSQSGQYTINLTNHYGCDSTVSLNLTVLPKLQQTLQVEICQGDEFLVGAQSFTESGEYTIALINMNGCDSLINLSLTVNPTSVTNLEKTICNGSSYLLGNQSFNQEGQYEVLLSSSEGCDSLVRLLLHVIALNSGVTQTQNTLAADLAGIQYQWFNCDNGANIPGATDQVFISDQNGKFGVILTDDFGCVDTSNCFQIIISGTDDVHLSDQIYIYPNPTNDYINVYNNSGYEISSINILNSVGQKLKTITSKLSEKISIAELIEGGYILEIFVAEEKVIKKLVVVRN